MTPELETRYWRVVGTDIDVPYYLTKPDENGRHRNHLHAGNHD